MRPKSSLSRRILRDLERRGMSAGDSRVVSERLAPRARGLDAAAYQSLLDGAMEAWEAQNTAEAPDPRERELQEIERLMGSFAGELGKLDEVLEVLAAHVQRMRSNSARTAAAQSLPRGEATTSRTLH